MRDGITCNEGGEGVNGRYVVLHIVRGEGR